MEKNGNWFLEENVPKKKSTVIFLYELSWLSDYCDWLFSVFDIVDEDSIALYFEGRPNILIIYSLRHVIFFFSLTLPNLT